LDWGYAREKDPKTSIKAPVSIYEIDPDPDMSDAQNKIGRHSISGMLQNLSVPPSDNDRFNVT